MARKKMTNRRCVFMTLPVWARVTTIKRHLQAAELAAGKPTSASMNTVIETALNLSKIEKLLRIDPTSHAEGFADELGKT